MIFSNKFGEGRTLWINSMRQCDLGDISWHTHHLAKYGGEPSEVQARPPEEERGRERRRPSWPNWRLPKDKRAKADDCPCCRCCNKLTVMPF